MMTSESRFTERLNAVPVPFQVDKVNCLIVPPKSISEAFAVSYVTSSKPTSTESINVQWKPKMEPIFTEHIDVFSMTSPEKSTSEKFDVNFVTTTQPSFDPTNSSSTNTPSQSDCTKFKTKFAEIKPPDVFSMITPKKTSGNTDVKCMISLSDRMSTEHSDVSSLITSSERISTGTNDVCSKIMSSERKTSGTTEFSFTITAPQRIPMENTYVSHVNVCKPANSEQSTNTETCDICPPSIPLVSKSSDIFDFPPLDTGITKPANISSIKTLSNLRFVETTKNKDDGIVLSEYVSEPNDAVAPTKPVISSDNKSEVLINFPEEDLAFALFTKHLKSNGKDDFALIIEYLKKNPDSISKVKSFLFDNNKQVDTCDSNGEITDFFLQCPPSRVDLIDHSERSRVKRKSASRFSRSISRSIDFSPTKLSSSTCEISRSFSDSSDEEACVFIAKYLNYL